MFKKIFTLSLLLIVFLAACQSAATSPTALPGVQDNPDQTSQDEPATDLPPLPEVSPTPPTGEVEVQGETTCTVVSRQPTPGPTEQSIVPPLSDSDWAHGPEDAKVTIIEYGDFQ
jgi:hypothetical protein